MKGSDYMQREYYQISIPIFAEITGRSENKIRKDYRQVISDECIPLSEIPQNFQEIYVCDDNVRDKLCEHRQIVQFIHLIVNLFNRFIL